MTRKNERPSPSMMVRFLIDVVGLKQREIADYLGVSQAWVSLVYHRKRKLINFDLVDRLFTLYSSERRIK